LGIDQDQAAVAFDNGHIGDVDAAHLVDALSDLEQSVGGVELRLPPQAWIDGRRHLVLLQERVAVAVERRPAARARHHAIRQRRDEAAPGILEIGAIGKRQRFGKGLIGGTRSRFRVPGLC